jgi:FtsH-binding integral membrane protein
MGVSFPAGTIVRTGAERATLVRRTYSLVFVSVLVTIVGAMFALSQPRILNAVAQHPFITIIAMFAPLFLVMRAQNVFPLNIALVFLFTFVMGVSISPALYVYGQQQPGLITQAALLTIGAFGSLTAYAFIFRSPGADLALAGVTVLVFSGLLVFDTWRIRNVYGPDEYVAAAVNIYLDLLNLFMALLRILGGRRN